MTLTEPVAVTRPTTPTELWLWVKHTWGIALPTEAVCPDHTAPFTAFCEAYFATASTVVWEASRGYGGKSFMLAVLAQTEAVTLGAESSVIAGSSAQSLNVHNHSTDLWANTFAPTDLIIGDPTKFTTKLSNGGKIVALAASQKQARGPHPNRLRCDEADEMDIAILTAAMGQPMRKNDIETQTVISSTHQHPDGTFTWVKEQAAEKGWPIRTWCYRESMGTDEFPGWLDPEEVERKRAEVPERFWLIEYDLQEPSFEGRAIDEAAVEAAYEGKTITDVPGEMLEFAAPDPKRIYCTGVDWAKAKDWTVIRTFDTSTRPWREVAYERVNRMPWPDMVARVNERMLRYPGVLAHDATGLGGVVADLLDLPRRGAKVLDVIMAGRPREILFNEYISAIEDGEMRSPRIEFPYREHLYVRREDLFTTKGHPPDSFVAGALAWSARNELRKNPTPPPPISEPKSATWGVTYL